MSSTFTIAEAGRRSGFRPSALRYYEAVGLLPPPDRSAAGYRTYDDAALERLRFVARAKRLGCTLSEISDLVDLRDGHRCEPLQTRLRDLLAAKIEVSRQEVTELLAFTAQLQEAAAGLARHTPPGPCDATCGCSSHPGPAPQDEQVIACTLSAAAVPGRLRDWEDALRSVSAHERIEDGVRITFAAGTPVEELVALAAAEQGCCGFLRFALTIDERGTALEVRAPADAMDVVETIFGPSD